MSPTRRVAGTTLIEVLVVMVIFLVGILAVVQIFPKGFQILILGRNNSVATALSRDEVERLKERSDELPEMIVAAESDGNNYTVNPDRSPDDLGPECQQVTEDGSCVNGSTTLTDWTRYTGPNNFRHIVGEGRTIPAPRLVGSNLYGGLVVLNFGPIDFDNKSFAVYGNDMLLRYGRPEDGVRKSDDEFFIENPQNSNATLYFPTGPDKFLQQDGSYKANNAGRFYYVTFSAYMSDGSGGYVKKDFLDVPVPEIAPTPYSADGVQPLSPAVPLAYLTGTPGSFISAEIGTLRVRRGFVSIPASNSFDNYEPYAYRLLNPELGVLLFSPYSFGLSTSGLNGPEALRARISYDVYDWRILREEFRFPYGQLAQHQLAVGSIKVGGAGGFDGRQQTFMPALEGPSSPTFKANNVQSDFFTLVDLDTGGVYMEKELNVPASTPNVFISVNKSNGLVTVRDLDPNTPGTQADLMLPDGTVQSGITIDNRAVRALYMARNEFAVQVLKAPSVYTITYGRPGAGQYHVGGTGGFGVSTRIYFPKSDAGRKVTIDVINYRRSGDVTPRQILGQDFVISYPTGTDPTGLPCVDITQVDSQAVALDATADARSYGYAASGVKGSSVAVRTLWNPQFFHLGSDGAQNMTKIDQWGRGWRRFTNETFLQQGDVNR